MSQYTEQIQQVKAAFDYIDQANGLNALEAMNGRITYYYNHGGKTILFLRDQEYNGTEYKSGDQITTEATDEHYKILVNKYNNHKPFKLWAKLQTGYKHICSMLKF